MDNQFIGRMGSFSFLPYNKSDDVKRWSTLWYPSGGKSHAYNLLGGKQRFLKLELSLQKKELIEALNKSQLELDELNPVITNFQHRLEEQRDNPIMRPLIEAQIESRVEDRNLLFNTISEIERRIAFLERLNSSAETEIVEANKSLQLVYSNSGEGFMKGQLVDTLPNSVPLERDEPIFTLAVETLLAYYGISSEQVEVSNDSLKIFSLDGDLLINAPMSDGQWLEVNYFSRWKESKEIETLLREARELYSNNEFVRYLELVPQILRLALLGVDNFDEINHYEIIESLKKIKLNNELVKIAQTLLESDPTTSMTIPSFIELMRVVDGIDYYSIPQGMKSNFNPMCGMDDILYYSDSWEQVSNNILALKNIIDKLKGPNGLPKFTSLLDAEPKNQDYQAKVSQYTNALNEKIEMLLQQEKELNQIDSFFALFKDAIVLIGPVDATFKDVAPTPFDKYPVPSVSAHGNTIKTLANQVYLKRLPIKVDHIATLIICIIMAALAVYQGKRASLVQTSGILLLVLYLYFGFETFAQSHIVWPITAPACAGLSTSFIGFAAMVVIEQKAKGRLKGMFGSYVSSELVEQMVASGEEPSLGGEETEITAFFSDVQAFSSFSELLTPNGLVDLMNEYLTAMTNILQEERGTLDKYIGDAIVAMYGAPIPMKDHAYQAVRTSILMQQKQIELRKKWVPEVEKWGKCHGLVTQMQTRIGCNTGTATVGNMGALDRFNYTMMGDMVNLAARCESGAKAYGAYIMVTEETKLSSEKTKDDIAFRYLDKIVVKGRSQPVAMYEPTGFMSELTQETQDCLDCFQQGIDKYLAQDWKGALNLFEKAKEMEPNKPGVTPGVKDNPSMILIDRCKVMMENPPGDDWDGVYVMTTK